MFLSLERILILNVTCDVKKMKVRRDVMKMFEFIDGANSFSPLSLLHAWPTSVVDTLLRSVVTPCGPSGRYLLQVLLIQDPETDKEAAAMDVRVGQTSDPPYLQGTAHFCEHMLFMGTGEEEVNEPTASKASRIVWS